MSFWDDFLPHRYMGQMFHSSIDLSKHDFTVLAFSVISRVAPHIKNVPTFKTKAYPVVIRLCASPFIPAYVSHDSLNVLDAFEMQESSDAHLLV